MKAVSLFLISILFSLFFFLTPVLAYYDISVGEDSHTSNIYTTTNYGSEVTVFYRSLLDATNDTMFISFDISSIPENETITNATIYMFEISHYTVWQEDNEVATVIYNTTYFTEDNITFANQPSRDTLQQNLSRLGDGGYDLYVVTDAVKYAHIANDDYVYFMIDVDPMPPPSNILFKYPSFQYPDSGYYPFIRIETSGETGCSGYTNGSYCTGWNYSMPCCYSEILGDWTDIEPPECTYDTEDCYDIYGDIPNPYDAEKRIFTVYDDTEEDCISDYKACPENYMCVQFFNPVSHEYEGKVSCYNGYNGSSIFYNETGDLFNGTEYIETLTVCTNPFQYTNSWSCTLNYCNWCSGIGYCTFPDFNCTCVNTSSQCYDASCHPTPCFVSGDEGMNGLRDWINDSMSSSFGSDIISLLASFGIAVLIFVNLGKEDKNPTILYGSFMIIASIFAFVGLLTVWFLVLEITVISVFIFWKVKGG